MPWKMEGPEKIVEIAYEVHLFPFVGDLDSWRVYVANNEKDGRKAFKDIVSQWKKNGIIVYDAIALRAKEIEAIQLVKINCTVPYSKRF